MSVAENAVKAERLREDLVKQALSDIDWAKLKLHLERIALTMEDVGVLCGHIRRYSDWVAKYPRKAFEKKREAFFKELANYVREHVGAQAPDKVTAVLAVMKLIEHGYRSILDVLEKCAIGKQPAEVRVAACISRACYEYADILHRQNAAVRNAKSLDLMAGVEIRDDDGNIVSGDAVVEGLAASVAMTVIMEAYTNQWFVDEVVVLPGLPQVEEEERFQSGATQVMALYWRHWQRLEKRRRYLDGEIRTLKGAQRPPGTDPRIEAILHYLPVEDGLSEREVYDHLANERLKDRLLQTFMEMDVEHRISDRSVGIDGDARLPPDDFVSPEEIHSGVSLSEILGYAIVDDKARPGGLRLLEWLRGYAVLKELGQQQAHKKDASGDAFLVVFVESELLDILERCGLERDVAVRFIEQTVLHRSSRDMFDCPLIRMKDGKIILFTPAVIDVNIPLAILSNLSNRGEELGAKGKAFEEHIRDVFRRNKIEVFAFAAKRDGETFEYDAVVAWDDTLFVFECKNRSLSGNDPVSVYYFDLEIRSQAKQAARLADALRKYPDIVEKEIGAQYVGKEVVASVLHSLPYSRLEPIDGVYFTDASTLIRFLEQEYFRVKVPHRIGNATLLHRTALKKFWKGDKPTADDLRRELAEPFPLKLSVEHLEMTQIDFAISQTEAVIAPEITRKPMTTRSACEAVGVDADAVINEIMEISGQSDKLRKKVGKRRAGSAKIKNTPA
ncbi:NERD domain-containing protein [Bradyrhizobium sp. LA6.7]|uniref:NERD domain-containing protein n=1 Tax=unclassified Bradyrhizobium TaxID=2631580 RepID=UPI003391F6D7